MKNRGVRKPKKRLNPIGILVLSLILMFSLIAIVIWGSLYRNSKFKENQKIEQSSVSSKQDKSSEKEEKTLLDQVKKSDWELVLVNLANPKEEMNPELTLVGNIEVDSRIAQNVLDFHSAAQEVDSAVHFISGYRSVDYQAQIFEGYVEQTMAANPDWTEDEARAQVMRTSQPPGSSEHQTGLAVDMSTVDELNTEDPVVAEQIAAIAPEYGFILRFPEWGSESTGIDYEDWHFRYVGVETAKYITENQLTLETFLEQVINE
ncbi:MAG: M15 family metallopeptidase [Lactovum sp.]